MCYIAYFNLYILTESARFFKGVQGIFLDNNEIFGAAGDVLAAILLNNGHILNADTEFTGQIDAGTSMFASA